MDAKKFLKSLLANEEGQSIFEFLLMFPFMLGIVAILIKVNMAIQMAIVDQQYARGQTFFLSYNNAYYPELRFKDRKELDYMALGVANNLAPRVGSQKSYLPEASVQNITRTINSDVGNDDPHAEPNDRGKVRIRNSVGLCTHSNAPITPTGRVTFCRKDFQ